MLGHREALQVITGCILLDLLGIKRKHSYDAELNDEARERRLEQRQTRWDVNVLKEGPVSYTHLDVYKRQPLSRRRRGRLQETQDMSPVDQSLRPAVAAGRKETGPESAF